MQARETKILYQGAISYKKEVTLVPPNGRAETDELRAALATVERYKRAAFKAMGLNEKGADWTMVDYAVKTDCVVVTVEQGACG